MLTMGLNGTQWGAEGHSGAQWGDTEGPEPPTHLRGPQPLHAALQRLPQPTAQLLDALHLQGTAMGLGGNGGGRGETPTPTS